MKISRLVRLVATSVAMLTMVLGVFAGTVGAQGAGGNEFCPDGLLPLDGDQINTEDGVTEYSTPNDIVSFWLLGDKGLEFSSSVGVDAVVVKGGPSATTYFFDEALTSTEPLYAPINASGLPAGISNVRFCYDPDPVQDNEWCSPGFWMNNPTQWPVEPGLSFKETMGYTAVGQVKGKAIAYPDATLGFVISNPNIFASTGEFENVADYLSDMHSGINYTGERYVVIDGVETHVCPLEGDGN